MESGMETKICKKCGSELSIDMFGRHKLSQDGLRNWCKECVNEDQHKRSKKVDKLKKVYSNPELAKFKPRDLIEELKARGYTGELRFEQKITL